MIVCNRTALSFATKVTSRRPPQAELVLIVKGVWSLDASDPVQLPIGEQTIPRGDKYAEGDDEGMLQSLYPSDFADFKPNAEVMVLGHCHAPAGRAVTECEVAASVGTWSKKLRVVGHRVWVDDALGSHPSDPVGFARLPIDWSAAFGGTQVTANPSGRGAGTQALPNVFRLGEDLTSRSQSISPAGFGPINPRWPQRMARVGSKYGKDYQSRRAPYYPEDFDFRFFRSAAEDQQLDGYLRGDEAIQLQNLVARDRQYRSRLPAVRVRALMRKKDEEPKELTLGIDTLVIDTDAMTMTLVWRGLAPISHRDQSDVHSLLIASESLSDPPLPRQEYEALLREHERDPVGLDKARAEFAAELDAKAPDTPLDAPDAPPEFAAKLESEVFDGMPRLKRHLSAKMGEALASTPEFDQAKAKETGAPDLKQALSPEQDAPPVPLTKKPGGRPSLGLRRQIRGVLEQVAQVKAKVDLSRAKPEERERIEKLALIGEDPNLPLLDPDYTPPEPLSGDAPGPYANLLDRDFTGQDLSGKDLSGANLEGALLIRTNLQGANLRGASLRGAVLFKADLSGADLSGADLTRANLAGALASRCKFVEANLEQAFFEGALLHAADLSHARGEYVVFARADLTRANLMHADLLRADCEEATLERASLVSASLRGALMPGVFASGADFSKAQIYGLTAQGADFSGARFAGAEGGRNFFEDAKLDEADFSLAKFTQSQFGRASAPRANFYGCDLAESRFSHCELTRAVFVRANLRACDFSAARIGKVSFKDANLYESVLLEASGEGVLLDGAFLVRATFSSEEGGVRRI